MHSLRKMTNRVKDKKTPLDVTIWHSEQAVWSPYPIALVCRQSSKAFLSTSSTVWLTKAVDISASYPVHVVVYTVPSLRRPPVLLVQKTDICMKETIRSTLGYRTVLDIRGLYGASLSSRC